MSRGLTSVGLRNSGGHICHLVLEDATEKPCNGAQTDSSFRAPQMAGLARVSMGQSTFESRGGLRQSQSCLP